MKRGSPNAAATAQARTTKPTNMKYEMNVDIEREGHVGHIDHLVIGDIDIGLATSLRTRNEA